MTGSGFVKLYGSILDSSVWSETTTTRIVWITLLAMADGDGSVSASVGGLARRAQVSREDAEAALAVLLAPDPDDRSGVEDGRRLRVISRGWQIVNHRAYRDLRTTTQVKTAERVKKHRHQKTALQVTLVTAEEEEEEETEEDPEADPEADPERERAGAREDAPNGGPTQLALDGSPAPAPVKRAARRKPSTKAKPSKTWRRVPADWQPTPEHEQLAAKLGVDLPYELEKFRDHEYAKLKTDADAAFRTWLKNARDFAPRKANGRRGPITQPNDDSSPFKGSAFEEPDQETQVTCT